MKPKTIITFSQFANKIMEFEGCPKNSQGLPKVYLDSGGIKTVGYGHTGEDVNRLSVGDTISLDQAKKYLYEDIAKHMFVVLQECKDYYLTANQLFALTSFCYNIGTTRQLTDNCKRSKTLIAQKMLLYNKCDGKVLEGLCKRRKWESELFKGESS